MSDLFGDIFGSILGYEGVQDTNNANREISQQNNAFNAEQAQKSREWSTSERLEQQGFNSAEAAKNRDWQENMSNTSWQRGVKDMEAAGINPMLAVMKGGASTPGGGQATSSIPGASTASSAGLPRMENRLSAMLPSAQALANLQNLQATTGNIEADTKLKLEQAKERSTASSVNSATVENTVENTRVLKSRIAEIEANVQRIDSEKRRNEADIYLKKAQRNLIDAEELRTKAQTTQIENYGQGAMFQADLNIRKAQQILIEANVPFAKQQAEFSSSNTGHIVNWLRMFTGQSTAQNVETLMKGIR